MRRGALTEAISHFNRGLEVISTLPPSSERDASELELHTAALPAERVLRREYLLGRVLLHFDH